MKKEILITGSTGGLGQFIVKRAVEDNEISHVYCEYRNQDKFDILFPHAASKIVPGIGSSFLISELRKNKPDELICVLTSFAIIPIGKIGIVEQSLPSNMERVIPQS